MLRGSVAGLCELRLLRERQEVRVRRALRGGEDLDRQLWELERQLGELRLRAVTDSQRADLDANNSESCDVFLDRPPRTGQTEARMHYASERPKSAGDLVVGSQHPRSSSSRLLVPRSMSAPYPSPSSPPPPPARRAEGYILSLLRRQLRTPYMRSVSAERPSPPPPPLPSPIPAPTPACRMATNTSYTPVHRGPRRKHPPLLKGRSVEGSPPRPPRKCLSAEEPPRKRGGRRTPRSLSETSLRDPIQGPEESVEAGVQAEAWGGSRGNLEAWGHPRNYRESWANARSQTEGWADQQAFVPEWGPMQEGGRCYTLGREGRAPPVRLGPPCRKWRSTAEISAGVPEVETRVDSEGEEEEEEGELVWPMQLPPCDAEGRPQVFKVKASQALKKKIMRFHTGSLKVMTTV